LDEIPERTPVLVWDWVVRSHDTGKLVAYLDYAKWRDPPDEYKVDSQFAEKLKKAELTMNRRGSLSVNEAAHDGDLSCIS
jgi:hypothetical protein